MYMLNNKHHRACEFAVLDLSCAMIGSQFREARPRSKISHDHPGAAVSCAASICAQAYPIPCSFHGPVFSDDKTGEFAVNTSWFAKLLHGQTKETLRSLEVHQLLEVRVLPAVHAIAQLVRAKVVHRVVAHMLWLSARITPNLG
jgi:hypothetical protein